MDIFDRIKQEVSMNSLVDYLGIKTNRSGYIVCPFHNEKTASLKIYSNNFYCFGCGTGGTVIDFIKKYMNMDNLNSAKYIAKIFNISNEELTIREKYAYNKRKKADRDKKSYEEWKNKAYEILINYYWILKDASTKYDLNNDLYVEAIHRLPVMDYYLDWIMEDVESFYKINRRVVMKIDRRINQLIK